MAGSDIEEHEFIRPLCAVGFAEFHGVTRLAEIHEAGTLYGTTVLHIEAGDDALG